MFHSVACRQILDAPLSAFIKGHFYGFVQYKEGHLVDKGYNSGFIQTYPGDNSAQKVMKKHPNEFKVVYESKPFLNSYHKENTKPYLILYVLEKL